MARVVDESVMMDERRLDLFGLGFMALVAQTLGEHAGAGGGGVLIVAHSLIIR
jgi:hypothetical protein